MEVLCTAVQILSKSLQIPYYVSSHKIALSVVDCESDFVSRIYVIVFNLSNCGVIKQNSNSFGPKLIIKHDT